MQVVWIAQDEFGSASLLDLERKLQVWAVHIPPGSGSYCEPMFTAPLQDRT